MKYTTIMLVLILLFIALIAYNAYPIIRAKNIDKSLVANVVPYTLNDPSRTRKILILGDSTAVGVGAASDETVAARLAKRLNASVENYAKSGAVTADLTGQISQAQIGHYDLIHIQIGANDVIGFKSLQEAGKDLDRALSDITSKTEVISVITAGDIGKSPIFKWPLSVVMSYRTRELRNIFMEVCAKHGAIYVDIFSKPDMFSSDIARYHSADGLHLSGEGYKYWYELLMQDLETSGKIQ